MKVALQLAAIVSLLASAGCHDLTDTKRWSSMRWDDNGVDDVEASVYVAPGPAATPDVPASNPVSSWSDRAQGAFVTAMAAKTSGAQAFRDMIVKPKTNGDGAASADLKNYLLVVTLTRPAGYVPGDRIARVVLRVLPINFTLGGYTIAQTNRQTYSVTALTRTAGLEENLSAGTPSGAPVTASAGIKATQGSSSVTPLTESAETLTIDMIPSCMRMVQEGAHSLDLTGNVKIATSLLTETAPGSDECRLSKEKAEITPVPTDPTRLFIVDPGLSFKGGRPSIKPGATVGALRPFPALPLAAKVDLEYVLRRVDSGVESYDESVQDVTLRRGKNVTCQVVVPWSQLVPPLYALYGPAASKSPMVKTAEGDILMFTSLDAARSMESWMNISRSRTIGSEKLTNVSLPVTAKRAEVLPNGDPCDGQPFEVTEDVRVKALAAARR